jgi:hypothetical protein
VPQVPLLRQPAGDPVLVAVEHELHPIVCCFMNRLLAKYIDIPLY